MVTRNQETMNEIDNHCTRLLIDKYMVDHSGDFGSGNYSIHRDWSNCVGTVSNSNCGHMVLMIYVCNKNSGSTSGQKSR